MVLETFSTCRKCTASSCLLLILALVQTDANGCDQAQINVWGNANKVLAQDISIEASTGLPRSTTYGLLSTEELPRIEEVAANVRDRSITKSDTGGVIDPVALELQLHRLLVGVVCELNGRLGGTDREFPSDLELNSTASAIRNDMHAATEPYVRCARLAIRR